MNALPVSSSTSSHLSPSASASTSPPTSTSDSLELLLQAVGEEVVKAYREKYIPSQILQACPTIYSYENALKWVNLDKFAYFVAQYYQERSPPSSPRPVTSSSADSSIPVRASLQTESSVAAPSASNPYAYPVTPSYADTICTSRDAVSMVPQKRPHSSTADADANAAEAIHERHLSEESLNPSSKRNTKQALYSAAGYIQLTRQSWVNRVEYLKEIPLHWRVPSGDSVAYLLDLSDDPSVYVHERNKRTTMSALIKQKCTDAWSGGTGGSLTKATTVPLLGPGVKCQKMAHDCRGVFLCSRVDPELWKDYDREDRDENSEYPLFASENALDAEESGGLSEMDRNKFERAVRFYNTMVKEKCFGENGNCLGKPEYKSYDAINFQLPEDQRSAYIGCSANTLFDPSHGGHFYHEIPSDVDLSLLIKLFAMRRTNLSDMLVFNRSCTFTVPPRTGNKQKYCPHIHVENGDIFEATMWQRPCPAKITIMSPIDHEIRKAVVVPAAIPHNHPFCPWDKRTRKAKAAERAMHNGSEDGNGDADVSADFEDDGP